MTAPEKEEQTRLDPRAIERVSGPSWVILRSAALAIANTLLAVSRKATNELTTIYVKFSRPGGQVYAVMWVKKSDQLVVGLALPGDIASPRLHAAPSTMKYPGLTSYFTVKTPEEVPPELATWARQAFENG